MPITPEIDNWLINAGYEYHCFISWAHNENPEYTMCARIMKEKIEQMLALSIPNPRVFLDESDIYGGADWERQLLRALCRSVSMVSLCAPIYYHPRHHWCGKEWAAMSRLKQIRLPNEDYEMIIPLLIRGRTNELPPAISPVQCIDFSPLTTRGRRYFSTIDFRMKVQKIIERIEMVAQAIVNNQSVPDCGSFIMPQDSAFLNYQVKPSVLPFRGT